MEILSKKRNILSFILALILGILLVGQFYAQQKFKEAESEETSKTLAMRISIASKKNDKLREEMSVLKEQSKEYEETLKGNMDANVLMMENLDKYKKISGINQIEGPGVELEIKGLVYSTYILDLLNTIRNIGNEGVSINNKRIIYSSHFTQESGGISIDGKVYSQPFIFKVIGDKDLLYSSLTRTGGLIERIMQSNKNINISVNKKDNIQLPSYNEELKFKHAKVIE